MLLVLELAGRDRVQHMHGNREKLGADAIPGEQDHFVGHETRAVSIRPAPCGLLAESGVPLGDLS